MASTDIVLDENYSPAIQNGDFVVGAADEQNVALILISNPGEWKNAPIVGCGLQRFLKSSSSDSRTKAARVIRLQVEQIAKYKITKLDENTDIATMLQTLVIEIK